MVQEDEKVSFGAGDVTIQFSDAQRAALRKQNALDLELYEFARARSRLITEAVSRADPAGFAEPHYTETAKSRQCSQAYRSWADAEERRKRKQLEEGRARRRAAANVAAGNLPKK